MATGIQAEIGCQSTRKIVNGNGEMFARYLIAWLLSLALAAMSATVMADIYTWIDRDGTKTYSDQPPPKGVQLLSVTREPPAKPLSPAEQAAQRDAAQQAQIQALSERLRWLEREAQLASRLPPAPAPVQYVPAPPAPCDPRWSDCGAWWSPPLLSAPVAIIRVPQAHHHFRGQHPRMDRHRGGRGGWR
jgi:hypothetical protein